MNSFLLYSNLPLKYALWTGAVGTHLAGRCALYSYCFSRPSDLMNHNGKRMKLGATRLTEAQQCEIIAKLSEQAEWAEQAGAGAGVWSQWRCHPESYGNDANWRTTYRWRNPTYRDICWIWKCYRLQRLWSSTIVDIDDQLLCSDVQTELDRCMMNCDDCLRHYKGTLANWQWMSSIKNSCIHGKWLYMTCSNNKIRTLIFVKKNCALNWDAYLNRCVLKQEITDVLPSQNV